MALFMPVTAVVRKSAVGINNSNNSLLRQSCSSLTQVASVHPLKSNYTTGRFVTPNPTHFNPTDLDLFLLPVILLGQPVFRKVHARDHPFPSTVIHIQGILILLGLHSNRS